MTIFGKHTVGETRDLIRATEFRVNQDLKQFEAVRRLRTKPQTAAQNQLDTDMGKFVRRWTDVRDTQTDSLTGLMLKNPNVFTTVLPAESEYKAVDAAVRITDPRLINIQQRLDVEAATLGLPGVDLSATPAFDSTDTDFNAMKRLDKVIAAAGNPLGKPGGTDSVARSPLGMIVIGGIVTGVVVVGLYIKKTLF